jgi:hypothetical protein
VNLVEMEETMRASAHSPVQTSRSADRQSGMALVLALMALMVVTVIGLTLAATTSTEVQVAANFRWSRQALYNAEAGLAVAKIVLANGVSTTANDFSSILPARTGTWPGTAATVTKASLAGVTAHTRNYENYQCDRRGNGMGNGIVVEVGTYTLDNVTQWPLGAGGRPLNGSFTVWMRRPVIYDSTGNLKDYGGKGDADPGAPPIDAVIILSEGVAPEIATAGSRAVQYVEATGYPYPKQGSKPVRPCDSLNYQGGGVSDLNCLPTKGTTIHGVPPAGVPSP